LARAQRLICPSDALSDGGDGIRFVVHRAGSALPAFVVRSQGAVYAYINECRHEATELDWNPAEFFDETKLYLVCATHGALYEPRTGQGAAGPCRGAGLGRVEIEERDGNIYCSED